MSFGGGGSNQNTQSSATIPWQLSPLISTSAQNTANLQSQLPLSDFAAANPQWISGLTNQEQGLLGMISGLAGGYTGPENSALGALNWIQSNPLGFDVASAPEGTFTGPETTALNSLLAQLNAPIGSSPATLQGMQAWQDVVAPQVRNQQALQGSFHGGAADEAIANSAGQAMVPLIQQEIQQRNAAIPQLMQLGGTAAQRFRGDLQQRIANMMGTVGPLSNLGATGAERFRSDLQNALEAAGVPREVANQQAQANYQDFLRRYQLAQQTTLGPIMQLAPSLIGTTQTTSSSGGK